MSAGFYYSIDTSAPIHGWVRAYPLSVSIFKPVWDRLSVLVAEGRLRASVEVFNEIKRKDDSLAEWCEEHPTMFMEIDEGIQEKVAVLLGKYPRLVDTRRGRSGTDPFVISFAQMHNPALTVVTEEKGGTADKPRIPYVCQQEDIRCISLLGLISEQS